MNNLYWYYPEVLNLPDNTFLIGNREFERYFIDFEKQIRQDFQFKDPISESSRAWANRIQNDLMPVSIHVRRGDYFRFDSGKFILAPSYYYRCVSILKENFPQMSLYVFSNDLQWCRQNFNFGIPTYFVDANDESNAWEEMFLITLCRHHIAGSGTFSWWSTWLDNRPGTLVFYPIKGNFEWHSQRFAKQCIAIDS